jgi:hypothetical protein
VECILTEANSSVHRHWGAEGTCVAPGLVSPTTLAAAWKAASTASATTTAMACLLGSRSSTSQDDVVWALAGSGGIFGEPLIPNSTGSRLRLGLGVVCHASLWEEVSKSVYELQLHLLLIVLLLSLSKLAQTKHLKTFIVLFSSVFESYLHRSEPWHPGPGVS